MKLTGNARKVLVEGGRPKRLPRARVTARPDRPRPRIPRRPPALPTPRRVAPKLCRCSSFPVCIANPVNALGKFLRDPVVRADRADTFSPRPWRPGANYSP